ncbi:TerC family protein [Roseisolibacter agri]|uniref:Membrane protein n=1 Tax=Roseisolibacter agri TaxID=2014610 RepID=A0AA37V9D7_9BACT|nr:TerC family protein [Roseisolibacter agri]GLC24328.1 membrane protein [Roseisolibacter agri]
MDFLSDPNAWLGLLTLTALEIVLGIDNIIFISILAGKLPPAEQPKARKLGLAGAFITRVALLFSISWIARLTAPLFTIGTLRFLELEARQITGRDLILIFGGLFLIGKATYEIHHKLEGDDDTPASDAGAKGTVSKGLVAVVAQIAVVDIVFSLDSVITAVGMVSDIRIMIAANVIALAFMLGAAGPISGFVDRHPTVKMLALSFLLLIGTNLVAEGLGQHIPKGYTYFAMFFSVAVEMLNLRLRKATDRPVKLRDGGTIEQGLVGEE